MFPRPAAPIFCSVSRVSEATLETFLGFSDYSSSFRAMVFPRPVAPIFCSVSKVLEATLETFLVGFSDYSSSFRAMVFPRPAAPIFCSVSRVSEVTLEIFWGILGLVRPSGPWCFPVPQRRFSVLFLGFQKQR